MLNFDWSLEVKKLNAYIEQSLEKFNHHILELDINREEAELSKYMLFTKSYNSFLSSLLLCRNGLHTESNNSIRLGLENGWLALLMEKNEELALEWLTLISKNCTMNEASEKYRSTFGRPSWVRKQLSDNSQEKDQRDKIYSILSIKSHPNVASSFCIVSGLNSTQKLYFYEPGGINDEQHKGKNLIAINFCLNWILNDIQNIKNVDLGIKWKYDENILVSIAGIGYPNGNNQLKVIPKKLNQSYQELLLLYLSEKYKNSNKLKNLTIVWR